MVDSPATAHPSVAHSARANLLGEAGEHHHTRLARDWPNRESSLFPVTRHVRWHVQVMGDGPALLLLHGTGSASHSWRDVAPLLAPHFRVIAPDLPGHGASVVDSPSRLSLFGMVMDLEDLMRELDARPALLVGHSAGAAIAVRLAVDGGVSPRGIVSLNGALLPFGGALAQLLSPATKLIAKGPWMARACAWRARRPSVMKRLLDSTGSRLDARGQALYGALARDVGHVAGALSMMANWDLSNMSRDLAALRVPLNLVVGSRDAMIPPAQAERVAACAVRATITPMPGYGHLAHEEVPAAVARIIERDARAWGVLPPLPARKET